MKNLDSILKSKDITLLTKVCIFKAMVFPVLMYRCMDMTVHVWRVGPEIRLSTVELMLLSCGIEDSESPLDSKEIMPVNPNGNQPHIFIGRTGVEAETPIFWPPYVKS